MLSNPATDVWAFPLLAVEIAAVFDFWLKSMNDENMRQIAPPTMPIHFVTELNFFALKSRRKNE